MPWTAHDRLLRLLTKRYLDDLCSGCGQPRLYSTRADVEGHYECPPATRCHACTAIEKATKKYEKQEQPRSLLFSVRPSQPLTQAISDPTLTVPPRLRFGTDGSIRATRAEYQAWAEHHGLTTTTSAPDRPD